MGINWDSTSTKFGCFNMPKSAMHRNLLNNPIKLLLWWVQEQEFMSSIYQLMESYILTLNLYLNQNIDIQINSNHYMSRLYIIHTSLYMKVDNNNNYVITKQIKGISF